MALSVQLDRSSPDWPLGAVVVTTPGTPVNIMVNVDAGNNNAPATPNTGNKGGEYTVTCSKIAIQGYHPGANNNGMVLNAGNIYVCRAGAGGAGNRSDSGSIVKVIPPGADYVIPESAQGYIGGLSPYRYFLDADTANDAGLVVLYGAATV